MSNSSTSFTSHFRQDKSSSISESKKIDNNKNTSLPLIPIAILIAIYSAGTTALIPDQPTNKQFVEKTIGSIVESRALENKTKNDEYFYITDKGLQDDDVLYF